ncbi:MAG: hypothetical protein NT135_00285, partial [Candidatus Berkelbacteria bacterium]|nr:hypothetical protein [Candidatus Berkelbacteria bacterium]
KKNIPSAIFTYEDAKRAFYGDPVAEDQIIEETWTKYKSENPEAPDSLKGTLLTTEYQQEIRKELRNQARKDFQYKVQDAYLIDKVDENIPLGFTKAMYQGTPEERTTMMGSYLISKVTKGEISITSEQMAAFTNYINGKTPENFQNLTNSGIFNNIDRYLNNHEILGFKVQDGTATALFKAAQGGENLKQGMKDLTNIYTDWAENQVFKFADKTFGIPVGSTYQVYQQYQAYKTALDAYRTAKDAFQVAKAAGDASKIAEATQAKGAASTNLDNIKEIGISLAINLVFGKTLSKLDQKLGLPPGTSSALVTLLLTGNPAALIIVVVGSFFTTKVEIFGETPICEKTASSGTQANNDLIKSLFSTILGSGSSAGYEKLSGKGEKDFPFYQRHAQCSVKRMIGALLAMPDKLNEPSMKPIQILTLRNEDVDLYAQDIYRLYGKTPLERGLRGVMSSDTFWQYVHIGY